LPYPLGLISVISKLRVLYYFHVRAWKEGSIILKGGKMDMEAHDVVSNPRKFLYILKSLQIQRQDASAKL
jgi:hypothetical protein